MDLETPSQEGILLVDKPAGKTSFYLVHLLRRLTKIKKIGHCGTLDPFATGVMVMLIGKKYTRQSDQFLGMDKEYETLLELGSATDTYDLDGQITDESKHIPSLEEVEGALTHFQGKIEQTPPMFSAKKVKGKKLYELAREGREVERKAAQIEVSTELIEYTYPKLRLRIACSKGTYIRSIGHELGLKLGSFGHLKELRRTRSGPFSIEQCIDIEALQASPLNYEKHLLNEAPQPMEHSLI